ncbi:MAG: hypothetical protein LQ351_004229 [Letrouitia transgressa]|nr:MAG: hypothetical protein LQ351_004229 [Letrouitia transgressa]
MRPTSFTLPILLLPLASASWTIDFYQKNTECQHDDSNSDLSSGSNPPDDPIGKTLTGEDKLDCDGGAVYPDGGKDSNAINIQGIKDKGLVVHLFSAEGCDDKSYVGSTDEDSCYISGELGEGSVNYVIVEKPPPCIPGALGGRGPLCR